MLRPTLFDGVAPGPGLLNLVRTYKERRITQHGIEEESLVRVRRLAKKRAPVQEVHVDVAKHHGGPGYFCRETQCDSLVRLNAKNEHVWIHPVIALEKHPRRSLEVNGNFRDALGHALAMPQVERRIRPTPVVQIDFERRECLS